MTEHAEPKRDFRYVMDPETPRARAPEATSARLPARPRRRRSHHTIRRTAVEKVEKLQRRPPGRRGWCCPSGGKERASWTPRSRATLAPKPPCSVSCATNAAQGWTCKARPTGSNAGSAPTASRSSASTATPRSGAASRSPAGSRGTTPPMPSRTDRAMGAVPRSGRPVRYGCSRNVSNLKDGASASGVASERTSLDRLPHPPVLSSVQTGNSTMTSDPTQDTTTFADLGLRPELLGALSGLGYEEPTPIQREAIP